MGGVILLYHMNIWKVELLMLLSLKKQIAVSMSKNESLYQLIHEGNFM